MQLMYEHTKWYRDNGEPGRWVVYYLGSKAWFPHQDEALQFLRIMEAQEDRKLLLCRRFTWGVRFSTAAGWIGAHWSKYNKRLCVNIVPFVTLWFVFPGGNRP